MTCSCPACGSSHSAGVTSGCLTPKSILVHLNRSRRVSLAPVYLWTKRFLPTCVQEALSRTRPRDHPGLRFLLVSVPGVGPSPGWASIAPAMLLTEKCPSSEVACHRPPHLPERALLTPPPARSTCSSRDSPRRASFVTKPLGGAALVCVPKVASAAWPAGTLRAHLLTRREAVLRGPAVNPGV